MKLSDAAPITLSLGNGEIWHSAPSGSPERLKRSEFQRRIYSECVSGRVSGRSRHPPQYFRLRVVI